MKLTKRDQKLLLILGGLLIFLAGYLGIYNVFLAKTEALQSEIDALAPTLAELQMHQAQLPEYEAGILSASDEMMAQQDRYPTHVRPEDLVMYALSLETQAGLLPSSLSFSAPIPLMEVTGLRAEDGLAHFEPLTASQSSVTINCQLDYPALKKMLDAIDAAPLRTTLDSISVSYDAETGSLSGAVTVNQFALTGPEDAYVPTQVPRTELGTDDLFGAIAVTPAADDATE